jgi:hypothetical protein
MRALRIIGLAAVLTAVLTAPASATWTEPALVAGTPGYGRVTGLAVARDGTALATWAWLQGEPFAAWAGSEPFPLPGPLMAPPVAAGPDAVALVTDSAYAYARADTAPRFRALPAGGKVAGAAVAARAGGRAAIAWLELRYRLKRGDIVGDARVRLATTTRGGPISRPRTVARTPPFELGDEVALAPDRQGGWLIAYVVERESQGFRVVVRRIARDGRRGHAQPLGPGERYYGTDLHVAAGPGGRAAVAWGVRSTEECSGEVKTVYAAMRPPGKRRFRPARLLGASVRTCESRTVGLAVGLRTLVGWSAWASTTSRVVHVAELGPGGKLRSNQSVATGDFGGLVETDDGTAILGWDDTADPTGWTDGPGGIAGPGRARAAPRHAGDPAFGAAEPVSVPGEDAGPPVLALHERTVTALWSVQHPDGTGAILTARNVDIAP